MLCACGETYTYKSVMESGDNSNMNHRIRGCPRLTVCALTSSRPREGVGWACEQDDASAELNVPAVHGEQWFPSTNWPALQCCVQVAEPCAHYLVW